MLTHLVIRNFAIIHQLEVPFTSGLTVLTGETGAGKSIVIDALNLLLGGRASTDVIRSEADDAVVEGMFELSVFHQDRISEKLREIGVDSLDSQLLVRRIVSRSGRNKIFINGCLTTLATLQFVTSGLVDISGQHEHISLMDTQKHTDILDDFAQLAGLRAEMALNFNEVHRIRKELDALQGDIRDRLNRIDFLKFQLTEIDAAKIQAGEDDVLEAEFLRLKNAEKIGDAARRSVSLLYDAEASVIARLGEASGFLSRIEQVDPQLATLHEKLKEARYQLEDVARELSNFTEAAGSDPARLDAVQARLEVLKILKRKHGPDLDTLLANAEDMRTELKRLENAEEHGEHLEKALEKAGLTALETARKLSQKRRKAASVFGKHLEDELKDLRMQGASLHVDITPDIDDFTPELLSAKGCDHVELLFTPNPGESPKSLARIASGGELSRIMLAMKTVLSDRDTIGTYIFDEVDTGIGGSTADHVGEKIARAAQGHQVICITHLAQIASRGQHHYRVEKHVSKGRTESTLRLLDTTERIEEIARMLGGARVTDTTRDAAQELLGIP